MESRMQERYRQLTENLWDDFTDKEVDLLINAYNKMIKHLQNQMKTEVNS